MDRLWETLLVEETASVLETHEAVLCSRGHHVVSFTTAEEAWEACQQERFDLAVVNRRLPGMGGLELCRRIRSRPWGKEAMILVTTEENGGNTLRETLEAGADDYLSQSADTEEFKARMTIAENCLRHRAGRRLEEAHYATLFESISDPILVHEVFSDGSFGRFTEVNEEACRLFGYSREELLEMSPLDIDVPEDRVERSAAVEEVLANRSVTFEHIQVAKDGRRIPVEIRARAREFDGRMLVTAVLRDLTGLREIEQELQRAHDELDLRVRERTTELTKLKDFSEGILSSMTEGIVLTNPEGLFTFMNPVVATMLGCQSPEELLGQPWQTILPPDQIPIAAEGEKRRARGVSDSYDLEVLCSDGRRVPCQISSSPRFEQGEFAGSLLVVTNLSERARMEDALRANMESHRALSRMVRLMADNMPDMLWAKDLDNRYVFTNSAICKKLLNATDIDEPLGKDDMFFAKRERTAHPDLPEWHDFGELCLCSDDIVLASGEAQRFDEFGHAQGEFLFLDVFKAPMWDESGTLIGTVGCARDVTKERADADKYRQGEAERLLLSTAIEQASDAVMITDVDSKIQYVNPAFEQMTGYSRERVLGQNPRILASGKHDREFYRELWETLLAKKEWRGYLVNRRADGTRYEEDVTIHPVCDESGEITNFVGIKRDVTEEAMLQKRSQQARKMAALGELSSGVAHDFNNLLTIIQGNVDLLRMVGGSDERVTDKIAVIDRATRSAAQLTRGLLAFSRQQILTLKPIDFNEFVAGVLVLLRRLLPDDIEVEFRPGASLYRIEGDETLLEQVLFNLCNNAAQAMSGGGKITLETATVMIEEDYVETHPWAHMGPHVALSVIDAGEGMDEETRERVLDPFFTTKAEGEGTGLGLSSAYGTIRQHGGAIELESELGAGTTVTLYLPAIDQLASAAAGTPVLEERTRGGEEAILIVEDLADLRIVLRALLESEGYNVQEACDGLEALEILRDRTAFDLVITDLSMPRMGGAELYHSGRELRPDLRFMFCSANLKLWEKLDCADDPRVSYLEKPFDLDSLGLKVREILDRELSGLAERAQKSDRMPAKPLDVHDGLSKPAVTHQMGHERLPGPSSAETSAGAEDNAQPAADSPIDYQALADLVKLERAGNPGFFALVLSEHRKTVRSAVSLLRNSIERGDNDALHRAAHGLKGSSGQLGALRLARLCERLQGVSEEQEMEGAREILAEVESEIKRIDATLREFRRSTNPPP